MERSRAGFSLIELLTVMAIMGVISIYVGQMLIFSDRAHQAVDQTTASQQSLRAIMDLVDRDIRHAGMMVPQFASVCGIDNTNAPDLLFVSDATAIDPQTDLEPYPGAQITGGLGTTVTAGSAVSLQLDSLIIETPAPARPAFDTDGNGVNDSDFRRGAGVIVADSSDTSRGTACGRVTSVDIANDRIGVALVSSLGGNAAGQYIAVPANEYRINNTQLLWNGVLLSNGIEDFQVAYIFDLNGNNLIDPGDVLGDGVGANYTSAAQAASDLRELRATFVARTNREDPEFAAGRLQASENRTPVATPDGFRRRVLSTRLRLRNVGAGMGVI
jgi:prepilin-type N-terminal cleavage/methylation domain-containing protein